jgi:cbb3-type cytochrome c oxidase subunit III
MSDDVKTLRAGRNTKLLIILGCVGTMAFLVAEARREHVTGEWMNWQTTYAETLDGEARAEYEIGLKQSFLPELERADRCQSCHAGIEDPAMAEAEQPLATHPGELLNAHPPELFGCSVCHEGQGSAVSLPDAHGEIAHWEKPLLRDHLVYTTCGRCHPESGLFGEEAELLGGRLADPEIRTGDIERHLASADPLRAGKEEVVSRGCLGCHPYRGRGGILGPELTHVGDKGVHGYDFSHLPAGAERTPLEWLKAHFLDPGAVSLDTVMPEAATTEEEAEALAIYMLSLRSMDAPARYRTPSMVPGGEALSGEKLYQLFCIACHGEDLAGSDVPSIRTPSLSNPDFLGVASDEYLASIIGSGRSNTNMPAWDESGGGLTEAQIDRIVGYIRSFEPKRAEYASISRNRGDLRAGRAIYRGNCATCHGQRGEGGLGTALASPQFLDIASDNLIVRTILEGRPNTGMPAWKDLSALDVSDLLVYIRSWQGEGAEISEVLAYLEGNEAQPEIGERIFRASCAPCHGRAGEGIIGPSLNSDDFLPIVSDSYLAHAIRDGRPGSAMPAWRSFSTEDVGDVIAFVRGFSSAERRTPKALATQGDAEYGELLFDRACLSCHGEAGSGGVGPQIGNVTFLAHANDHFLFETIANGRNGTAMRGFLKRTSVPGGMRGGGGIADFTPAQIASIVAYLRDLRFRRSDELLNRPVLGSAYRGREIFEGVGSCTACHGPEGQGDIGPSLASPHFLDQATEGFLLGTMILGRSGTEMRDFASSGISHLQAEELMDVAAYVRTLPRASDGGREAWRSFKVTDDQITVGSELFVGFCASCHGENGKGGYAPELNNPEFLRAASDGLLMATIARGRRTTPMRAFGPGPSGLAVLTHAEIRDLVGYIRSWETRAPGGTDPVTPPLATVASQPEQETRHGR